MFETAYNFFSNSYKSLRNKVIGHYTGLRSLYLFINIINHVKYILNNNLYNDAEELDKLKTKILNCGCIGIKFTQWIIAKIKGTNKNNKYKILLKTFEGIFDDCGYHDIEHTKEIFENDFKKKLEDIFDMDDFNVIASGSIGQVYKTRFIKEPSVINNEDYNKTDVCIKIRHPYLDYIKSYQMILIYFIICLQYFSYFKKKYCLHFNLYDFIDNINNQIDFNIEAFNNIKMYESYKDNEYVVVPKVHNFSRNIIVSSFEEGIEFDSISEYQQCKVALNMLCLTYNMALIDNFMHGDLHLKNWKIRPYKKFYKIVLYDFGICFKGPDREFSDKLIFYCETQNIKKLIELFLDDTSFTSNKEVLIEELFNTFNSICLEPLNMNTVYTKLIYVFSSYNLVVNNLFLNIILFFCLVEDMWKKTNIICQDITGTDLDISSIFKNQKLDVISFCKTYNIYPELVKLLEDQLERYGKEEYFKKTEPLDIYKVSHLTFLNPDDI